MGRAVETVVRSRAERKEETQRAENTRKKCTRAVSFVLVPLEDNVSIEVRGVVVTRVVEGVEEVVRCAVDGWVVV